MRKKKLAIFINSMVQAGAENVVSQLVNHFHNEYDVHLILLTNTVQFKLPDNIVIKIIDSSKLKSKNRIKDILKIPILSLRLKKYLHDNQISYCISFLNRANFINCFLKLIKYKGTVVISERGHTSSLYTTQNFSGKTGRFLVKNLYKYADYIVPNSKGIVDDLKINFKLYKKYITIYNPLNLKEHARKMQLPVNNITFNKFTFVNVGRFEDAKNHLLLLEAVSYIKDHDFQVLIIGYGSMEERIRIRITELGICNKIILIGYQKDAVRYIGRSNCFVLSSNYEGFPNVLLESLASGTPIISTDCPTGPRELLTGEYNQAAYANQIEKAEYGIMVPIKNAELLSKAMLLMMKDADLQNLYSKKGKERAFNFDTPIIMKEFATLFEQTF